MQPLTAHTFNETRYYLMVTSCPACGKGALQVVSAQRPETPDQTVAVHTQCRQCESDHDFRFVCRRPVPAKGHGAERINLTDEPSAIIDLVQWLSLFYLLVETAAAEDSRSQCRRAGYQAALCLAEALKFYRDDELPPESAFFSEATAAIFRENPERYTRRKLQDMQATLPSLSAMARRLERDERASQGRWWQFWRT